jgi:hypothetical protein
MLLKKITNIILSTLISLLVVSKAYSQSPIIVMSATNMANGSPIISSPINMQSALKCIDVQTGIAVLSGNVSTGDFAINCEVNYKFNSLGIKLYPNPVVNATRVKFINPPPFEEAFKVSVWSTEGILVKSQNEIGINLYKGVVFNFNELHTGSYILKIESAKFVDAIKFIKAN